MANAVSVEQSTSLTPVSADERERLNAWRIASTGDSFMVGLLAVAITAELVLSAQQSEPVVFESVSSEVSASLQDDAATLPQVHYVVASAEADHAATSGDALLGDAGSDHLAAPEAGAAPALESHDSAGPSLVPAVSGGVACLDVYTGLNFSLAPTGEVHGLTLVAGNGGETLVGGDGNDILVGGDGNDVLIGGKGIDTASYANAKGAVTVTLTDAAAPGEDTGGSSSGAGGHDKLVSIENITGSAYNDTLSGNSGDNILDGGKGNDTASYAAAKGSVTVTLTDAPSGGGDTGGHAEGAGGHDTLISIENLTGSSHNDVLTGNSGDNVLNGGGGDDIFTGGLGADTFVFKDIFAAVNAAFAREVITDFEHNYDHIDLSGVNGFFDAFVFDGTSSNSNHDRGHFGVRHDDSTGSAHTYVEGNASTDSDVHNFQIDLVGSVVIDHFDFIV